MNKQSDLIIPDYSSFHREINDTSSPVNHDDEQQSTSSASSREIRHFETIINDYSSSSPKQKINSYESTDEDVDELNMDYSEDIDQSAATVQTYRDKLNARLNTEINHFRPRILSTEYSQITIDSGVDIVSEHKISHPKIDEQYSEETANQNDLFALSDDSLLDIEPPQSSDVLLKTPTIINEQSLSLTEGSDEIKSYVTALTDSPIVNKIDRGRSNTSDQYYSAESEFNTSLSFPNNELYNSYELETISDEDVGERNNSDQDDRDLSVEISPPPSPQFDFQLPSFGDWIDQVFTTFLAETNQHSTSTSRSSSVMSIHTSQYTIDTSSSQVLTVIENTKNNQNRIMKLKTPLAFEENNQSNSLHRRSQSWPNNEQQHDEQNFKGNFLVFLFLLCKDRKKNLCERAQLVASRLRYDDVYSSNACFCRLLDMSSSSLNNDNIDFNPYTIDTNNGKTNSIAEKDEHKTSQSLVLSSMENGDEGEFLLL